MNTIPKISVILCIYNVEPYIKRGIDSVLAQTFNDFECILVDDASPDACPRICDDYAKEDSRVKVIHKSQNGGLPQARKTGLEAANGEYILFVDPDDYIECDMLEKLYFAAAKENADMAFCSFFFTNEDGETTTPAQDLGDFQPTTVLKNILAGKASITIWTKLSKKSICESLDFPEHSIYEDWVIVPQIILRAKKIAQTNSTLYHYCHNSGSLSCNKYSAEDATKNFRKFLAIVEKEYGAPPLALEPELTQRINYWKYSLSENASDYSSETFHSLYPKISLILPIYNVEPYIERCLESILSQTFQDFECILVDDCSPDASPAICDTYAAKDKRIKTIHKENNEGASKARETGLSSARSEYSLFIDPDDYIERDMLEKLYTTATAESADVVICGYFFVDENGDAKAFSQDIGDGTSATIMKKLLADKIAVMPWNKLVKTSIYDSVEFPENNGHDDWVTTVQVLMHAKKVACVNSPLYYFCHNAASITNTRPANPAKKMGAIKNRCKTFELMAEEFGDNLAVLEPELSAKINYWKYFHTRDESLRKIKPLWKLYPQSHYYRYLFKRHFKYLYKHYFIRAIKAITPYGILVLYRRHKAK